MKFENACRLDNSSTSMLNLYLNNVLWLYETMFWFFKEIVKFLELQRHHVCNLKVSRIVYGNILILTFEESVKGVQEFFVLFLQHFCKSEIIFFKFTKRMSFFSHFILTGFTKCICVTGKNLLLRYWELELVKRKDTHK